MKINERAVGSSAGAESGEWADKAQGGAASLLLLRVTHV